MPAPRFRPFVALLLLDGCVAPERRTAPPPPPPPPPVAEAAIPPPVQPPTPAWQARMVVPNAVEVASAIYTVQKGDTLRGIDAKTGAGSEAIARANALKAPFTIYAGQKLKIPGGRYHRVTKGDSGIAIARAYGVDWGRVATMNALQEPYILRDGQRLLIPSAREVAAMSMEQRASAFSLDIDDIITGAEPALAANAVPAKPATTPAKAPPPTVAVAEPAAFSGRFSWPLEGPVLRKFGWVGSGQQNDGVNIGAQEGQPILAAADGVVAYVGTDVPAYGNLVLLRHGDGWITAYGHAAELSVTRGQSVKRGQIIGRAGESGSASRAQLHFEIRQGRKPVNPLDHLPKRG